MKFDITRQTRQFLIVVATFAFTTSCISTKAADPKRDDEGDLASVRKLLSKSDYDGISEQFEKLLAKDPLNLPTQKMFQDIKARLMKRLMLKDEQSYKAQAASFLRQYERLAQKHPQRAVAQYLLGRAAFLIGDLELAAQPNHRALELDPDFAPALLVKGHLMDNENGDVEEHKAIYTRVLKSDKSSAAAALDALASLETTLFRAVELLRKAVAADPSDNVSPLNLAKMLASGGDFDSALTEIAKVIERDPEFEQAHLVKGHILLRKSDVKGACAAFEREVEFVTDYSPEAAFELGKIYAQVSDLEKAREKFEWVIKWSRSERYVEAARKALQEIERLEKKKQGEPR